MDKEKKSYILWPGKTVQFQSYIDGNIVAYVVNVTAVVETEYFSNPHQEYRYNFEVDGIQWKLIMHPHGSNKYHNGFVSLHLKIESIDKCRLPVKVNCSFGSGQVNMGQELSFSGLRQSWGKSKWKEIKGDPIHVNFKLRYVKSDDIKKSPKLSLICLPWLYDEFLSQSTDIMLKSDYGTHPTYKKILMDISPKLSEQIENNENIESLSMLVKSEVAEILINFLHTGRLNYPDENVLEQLIVTAHEYSIEILTTACDQQLSLNLTVENAAVKMLTALKNHLPISISIITDYIKKHREEVNDTAGWRELWRNNLGMQFVMNYCNK